MQEAPTGAVGDDPDLYVLYGTESGNSKYLAVDMSKAADRAGIRSRVLGMDQLGAQELPKLRNAVFVISTTGDGEMPFNAVNFWDDLSIDGFPALAGMRFGVLALGESVYEDFCSAGIALDDRLAELGAARLVDRIDCDWDFETPAAAWIETAVEVFAESIASAEPASATTVIVESSGTGGRPRHAVRILEKQVLTRGETEREVVHYTIGLERNDAGDIPFDWQPGDSLNLAYGNDPTLVDEITSHLCMDPETVPGNAQTTIRQLLTDALELRTLSRDLVQEAASQDDGDELQRMLAEDAAGVFEEWRESHDLLELLLEHPRVRLDADQLVSLLRPLQPRAYSIASSPLLDPAKIDFSVRTVRYRRGTRTHAGVVSGGMSNRALLGDSIEAQHLSNPSFRLPEDTDAPIVMIGAGVGVAPFRAFLQHRAARGDRGRNWLFHGIRNPDEDELYADEFARWRADGFLSAYDVCASRVTEGRQYVQHRMVDHGRELFSRLEEGAVLYVCGDAHRMAKDVQFAVRAIAAEALGSDEKGHAFVTELQADHRYLQDVY